MQIINVLTNQQQWIGVQYKTFQYMALAEKVRLEHNYGQESEKNTAGLNWSGNHILPLLILKLFIITKLSLRLLSGIRNLTANLTTLYKKRKIKEKLHTDTVPLGNLNRKHIGFKIMQRTN